MTGLLEPLVAVASRLTVLGAAAGDTIGHVGRRWTVLDATAGRFVRAERLDRAEHALPQRGGWAVPVGRFAVALRVLVPGLAG